MIYSLADITQKYSDKTVLDIQSLDIEKGKIYALLGPNGAGKTTLLKILAFLDIPTAGRIKYHSKLVSFSEYFLQKLRKNVVMVNQRPILFTTTVFKNIEFGLKVRKIPPKKRAAIIGEVLDLVGMRYFINEPADKLSGGETQRVALARALAISPEVILCDEPTASVDLENQVVITNLLKQINEQKNITLIFTSHDKHQATSLAHHTLFLDHGKLATAQYENLFSAELIQEGNGYSKCVVPNGVVLSTLSDKTGQSRLLIDPEKIDIEKETTNNNNNGLKGSVVLVAEEKGMIRITAHCGIDLTILMSPEKYREKALMIGDPVSIDITPEAIQLI